MAYIVDIFNLKNSIEYEYKWQGKYGAKGEKRKNKSKATPEQIKKQNQKLKEKNTRRLIKLNFSKGDYWCTFLYPKGTRKDIEKVKDDFKRFLRKLRNKYKAKEKELKFIYRIEVGSKGGIHIHMICNNLPPGLDEIIQDLWQQGRVNFERFGGKEQDCTRLANYIVKPPNEQQQKQIDALQDKDEKALISYSTSRNLERPKAERKTYLRRTVRKLIEDGIKPSKGYSVVKESIYSGINPYTGMSFLYYTEERSG